MNTEKTPTIYGTVTFEQFNDAIETVCKYLDGLTNAYAIKDILTEEHHNKLEPDLLMASLSMLRVNLTQDKFIAALKDLQAELLEKKAAKERAAQVEPGDTYGPKTENL
jgi:ABC-type Fe3+ transport system substrate-binding protein